MPMQPYYNPYMSHGYPNQQQSHHREQASSSRTEDLNLTTARRTDATSSAATQERPVSIKFVSAEEMQNHTQDEQQHQ